MADFKVGDRVCRKGQSKPVGVIERIFTGGWYRNDPRTDRSHLQGAKARVKWENVYPRFHGGYQDLHSTIALSSLRLAAEPLQRSAATVEKRALARQIREAVKQVEKAGICPHSTAIAQRIGITYDLLWTLERGGRAKMTEYRTVLASLEALLEDAA